ncbi:MAG: hypothetical protein IPH40_12665 [Polaromonas sp.]|nr:hypothetical protein [Polaromonas sp.]
MSLTTDVRGMVPGPIGSMKADSSPVRVVLAHEGAVLRMYKRRNRYVIDAKLAGLAI